MKMVRAHVTDLLALLMIAVVGVGVAGYILSNQRFYLPDWVPVLGSDFVDYHAELQTAQAVVPGQGQTVNIAGVKVGEIGQVRLEGARAYVEMKVRRRYTPIHKDATILLRPKTGLKDMTLELDRGTATAGRIAPEGTIRVADTLQDVNPEEFLSVLDGDTRAYLRILLSSGAEALEGDAPASLRETFKRFEPTARDVRKVNTLLSRRRENMRRVTRNFSLVADELGDNGQAISRFVSASNQNFGAIARQERNLRQALRLLPSTLDRTERTLGGVERLARQSGPALAKLRPAARSLADAQRATQRLNRSTTPVIREQIRPFARDVRPVIADLRPAARDLGVALPKLADTFKVLNKGANALAYNPRGSEEGFLFWSAWGAHNGASLFSLADAHGPARRAVVLTSCSGLDVLEQLSFGNRLLGTAAELLNPPNRFDLCPDAVAPTPNGQPPVAGQTPVPGQTPAGPATRKGRGR